MKSHSKLTRLFGLTYEIAFKANTSFWLFTCSILDVLQLLGNIRRLVEHAWTAHYRWTPWQQIEMYGLFFY